MMNDTDTSDYIYMLAASPQNGRDGVCFAARQSGLYRSLDNGRTWQPAYESLGLNETLPTTAVAFSPNFAADQTVFAAAGGHILKSPDGGKHWQTIALPAPPPTVSAFAVSPNFAQDGVILAGTIADGVFRSADGGDKWTAWNFGLLDKNINCLAISPDFARDQTLFAGTESGIFASRSGGKSWREVAFPMELAPVTSLAIFPQFRQDGLIFAGTEENGGYVTKNAGQTWDRLNTLPGQSIHQISFISSPPRCQTVAAVTEAGLFITRDAGQAWVKPEAAHNLAGIICALAPLGLERGAFLIGRAGGKVEVISSKE